MFKKVLLTMAAVALVATLAWAQPWHTANQVTVAWDAVTTDENGDPLDTAVADIQYKVFVSNAITDPSKTNPVEVAQVATTEHLITLGVEGRYYVGVSTVRVEPGTSNVVAQSAIAWSDDTTLTDTPFGLRYFIPPGQAKKLRIP
jgi:hypothetical protein